MTTEMKSPGRIDAREMEQFRAMASDWWDPGGKFRPLHALGPVRLGFIRDEIVGRFALDARAARPLAGLSVADIGCGGGLLCEPLARLGASVVGVDPLAESIAVARAHAEPQGLAIRYLQAGAEELAAAAETFDAVIAMEVVEHAPDPAAFVKSCAALVRPGGVLILSTINRTLRSYALAIVGAEYVLRWLPRGTHRWEKFVTPEELEAAAFGAGLKPSRLKGCVFNPLSGAWSLSDDMSVNYFLSAVRPAA